MSKGKLWYSCPLCSKRRGYPNFRCVRCDRYHCMNHVEMAAEHGEGDGFLCRRCIRELASAGRDAARA